MKLRKGNVYTPVCQSFCSERGGGLPDRDPPGQRPPWTETPRTETPLDRDPLDRDPPGQRPPRTETPWTETPWTETPLDRDPWIETPMGGTHLTGMHSCWKYLYTADVDTGSILPGNGTTSVQLIFMLAVLLTQTQARNSNSN